MKKQFAKSLTLLLAVLLLCSLLLVSCEKKPGKTDTPDTPDVPDTSAFRNPRAGDPGLLNGMDNMEDLYALKPVDVSPYDAYTMTLNTDPAYTKAGEGSFRYTFLSGSSHTFLQQLSHSYHAKADVKTLKSVSVEVYCDSDTAESVTLSVTTSGGAALFSRTVTVAPKSWTTVSVDGLEAYSYQKKSAIGGVSFRFDAESTVTMYVDEMRFTLGAADLPPVDFNAYVSSIASMAPDAPLTKATFGEHVAFVDAVCYARSLYDAMNDKSQASAASKAALDRYTALLGGYETLYSPRASGDVMDRWSYGAALTVSTGEDPAYGAVYEVAVNARNTGEQSFRYTGLNVSRIGEIVFYVYNPTDSELKLDVHGGWNTWLAYTCQLPPKAWTAVTVNAATVENDVAGSFFVVISRQGKAPFEGVFRFTALYGVPGNIAAGDVIAAIDTLPAKADITLAHKNEVLLVRAAYDELSREARASVSNYARLTEAENRIAEIEAADFDAEVNAFLAQTVGAENAKELYLQLIDLLNAYDALSDLAAPRVTTRQALYDRRAELDRYLVEIVNGMIDALPEAAGAEGDLPRLLPQVGLTKQLYDALTEEQREQVTAAGKLQAFLRLCENYRLVFDFTVANMTRVSNTTDFGNAWGGTMAVTSDSIYGDLLVMNVLSGHANSPREAEFRLRDTARRIKGYQSIVFYVFAPMEGAVLRAWPSNWKNPVDYPLTAHTWTRISLDPAAFFEDCLDGMFFTVVAPAGKQPVGEWKISSFYAYYDEEETNRLVNAFVDAVNALPETSELTLADEGAVEAVKEAYRALPPHALYYVSRRYIRRMNTASDRISALKAQAYIDAFADAVNALPAPSDLTLADAQKVAAARAAYDAMPSYCLPFVDAALTSRLQQAETRLQQLESEKEAADFVRAVNALTETSEGGELYRLWLVCCALTETQKASAADAVSRLSALMTSEAEAVAVACAADIADLQEHHDFPLDADRCRRLYDAVLALPDAVFDALPQESKTTLSDLNRELKRYTVITDAITSSALTAASDDETYGTVYSLTVRPEGTGTDNLLFTLRSGTAGNRRIVFYLYRPEGGSDAFLYFTGDWLGWASSADTSVTVTENGWLRMEFAADAVANSENTSYWYLYLKNGTAAESGWRISDIYAC